jgi:outer membrane lipoprotein SlyB
MRSFLIGIGVVLTMVLAAGSADAKGCIKGALVGGIAGKMAGHGKMGAVAGCVIGRHQANKRDRERGLR